MKIATNALYLVLIIVSSSLFGGCSFAADNSSESEPGIVYISAHAHVYKRGQDVDWMILQMRQKANGVLEEVACTKLPHGWVSGDLAEDRKNHRLYVVMVIDKQRPGNVARYNISPSGQLVPNSPIFLPGVKADDINISSNGKVLYTEAGVMNTVESYQITGIGAPKRLSSWKNDGQTYQVMYDKSPVESKNPVMLEGIYVDPACSTVYSTSHHLLQKANDGISDVTNILQFNSIPSGGLALHEQTKVDCGVSGPIALDTSHGFLYASSEFGQVTVFAVGETGTLRLLQTTPAIADETDVMDHQKYKWPIAPKVDDDLIPINPSALHPDPSPEVHQVILDQSDNLLLGVGGESANEIDIWAVTSGSIRQPAKRYWYSISGLISGGDSRNFSANANPIGGASYGFLDTKTGYLYVEHERTDTNTFLPKDLKLFCFKIQATGGLKMLSSQAVVGKDLVGYDVQAIVFPPS